MDGKKINGGAALKTFAASGIIGKVILGMLALVVFFLSMFVWNSFQQTTNNNNQTKILEEIRTSNHNIEKLVESARQIDEFKECVLIVNDEVLLYYSELKKALGATLSENKVPFPQELNDAFDNLNKTLNKIPKCLIDPKKVK